ncbi:MAG: HAD-IC family P-type ATPase [Legionella sp.]
MPIDGVCEQTCSIFDTIITGSTIPRSYPIGEKIFAGMRLAPGTGPLKLRVTKPSAQSYLAKLDNNIAQALLTKAPIEITANKILSYFIPAVIGLALISGIVVSIFFPPALAIQCALSVLVSACPCTLGAIIPWAVKTGINKAAENGVQFKDADAVHRAASINVVVIDLHGTLTTGIPTISDFKALDDSGISLQELLNLACTLEKRSLHPVGKAVFAFAQERGGQQSTINLAKKLHHAGESGVIDEEEYFIGSSSLMHDQGIDTKEITSELKLAAGDSVVYVARKGKVLGYFIVTQALRKDAKASIDALKAMGKQVHLCTGADEDTARRYAKILSIDTVHAACVGTTSTSSTKNSKPAYIQSLINQGYKVAMVGDGDNDAHAIATSTFSIAVASKNGDEITQQKAGAVIQNNSLLAMVSAFAIAEQTATNIKQNLLMSFTYNTGAVLLACGILLVIGFAINPAVGAALMGIQACLILLNVYRFKHQSLPHLEKAKTESQNVAQNSNQKIHDLLPKVDSVIAAKNAASCTQNVGAMTQPAKLFPSPSGSRCRVMTEKESSSFDNFSSKISVL